jgi:hypothetical protein
MVTPRIGIAPGWMRYWFAGFHPDGHADPRKRHVTQAGTCVSYIAIDGSRRTGRLERDTPPPVPPCTFFDAVTRDSDGVTELVPASRIYPEGQVLTACSRCHGQPPPGFVCAQCGAG